MARTLPSSTTGSAWWSLVLLAGLTGLLAGGQLAARLRPLGALLAMELPFSTDRRAPSRLVAAARRIDASAPPAVTDVGAAMVEAARRATTSDKVRRVQAYAGLAARDAGADEGLLAWAVVIACAGPWRSALAAVARPALDPLSVEAGLAEVASAFDELVGPSGGDAPDTLFAARRDLAGRGEADLPAEAVRAFMAVPTARLRDVPGPSRLLVGTPLLAAIRGLGPAARPLGVATSGATFVVIAALSVTADRLLPAGVLIPTPFPSPSTAVVAPSDIAPAELAAVDDAGVVDASVAADAPAARFLRASQGATGRRASTGRTGDLRSVTGLLAAAPARSAIQPVAPVLTAAVTPAVPAIPAPVPAPVAGGTSAASTPSQPSTPTTSGATTSDAGSKASVEPKTERRTRTTTASQPAPKAEAKAERKAAPKAAPKSTPRTTAAPKDDKSNGQPENRSRADKDSMDDRGGD